MFWDLLLSFVYYTLYIIEYGQDYKKPVIFLNVMKDKLM